MENNLSKKEDIFSLTQEKIDIDTIKLLLERFNFNISEEQLPYIKIDNLERWRISFTNNFTKEICSAYYTSECPAYAGNCSFSGESESFLGQKIQSDSVIKMNWFEVQGERYRYDEFRVKPIYIPPHNRPRVAIIEEAIFSGKNSDGDFTLHIQKDYPKSDKKANLEVEIFLGTVNEVYPIQFRDVLKADYRRQIVRIKYGLNKDYNYFETGSPTNCGKLNETRYIYGRNMFCLTDYEYRNNALVDTRLVYGVDHYERDGTTYHGVISEDGTNKFENIQPIGMMSLATPLQQFEKVKETLISKLYFQGYEKNTGHKTLGIVKTKNGIHVAIDEMQYDKSDDFRQRIGFQRVSEDFILSTSEGAITIDEIRDVISTLYQKSPDDTFVKSICNELEMINKQLLIAIEK